MIENKEQKYKEINDKVEDILKRFRKEQDSNNGNGSGNSNNDSTPSDEGSGDVNDDGSTAEADTPQLSDRQQKQLEKALEKQKEFNEGNVKKTKLRKNEKTQVEAVSSSDVEIKDVQEEVERQSYYGGGVHSYLSTNKVVVVNKITDTTYSICGMIRAKDVTTWGAKGKSTGADRVSNGFRLGKMLAKKLQVRNDDTKTQYNRQRKGKIDRRLLADLGLGNNKIFEQSFITKASDAGIHISIDASGSMSGERFENAMTTATAIAVAMDMVGGIRVRIDVRSESESYGLVPGQSSYTPTVLVAYDSRVNNLTHIRKYFPKLCTSGGTPEGICFKAIEKLIMAGNNNTDKYFINLSDGEPNGDAKEITKKAVKTLKKNQIKVLSYFVSEHTPSTRTKDTFDYMYGTDSTEYIETDNIFAIAKTINKLLSNRA